MKKIYIVAIYDREGRLFKELFFSNIDKRDNCVLELNKIGIDNSKIGAGIEHVDQELNKNDFKYL